MTLALQTFQRKTFKVKAIRVTAENMAEIAEHCCCAILKANGNPYIAVDVQNPKTDRLTRAYAGDWVLVSQTGLKVFTDKAFKSTFELDNIDSQRTMLSNLVTDAIIRGKIDPDMLDMLVRTLGIVIKP